jgi:hypothetical protein
VRAPADRQDEWSVRSTSAPWSHSLPTTVPQFELVTGCDHLADMLDSTVESVNSALKRARASLQRRLPPAGHREPPPASCSPAEDAIVAKFVRAYESADLDALVALLTDDVFVSMPPMPIEYEGRTAGFWQTDSVDRGREPSRARRLH